MSYLLISPIRNEAKFIAHTIRSVVQQTILPLAWVIVDDGSTDGTSEILREAASEHSFISIVCRADRGFRKSGGGVVEAFYDGYATVGERSWEFLVKLDGDLSFEPNYFELCLEQFNADRRLGIGSGTVVVAQGNGFTVDSPNDPPFHVRGAAKMYRRQCWNEISPLMRAPGWDTIDEVKANMLGWRTRTFPHVHLIHHRHTGVADGQWRNSYKNGLANYVTAYHPLFMLGKCVKRSFTKTPLEAVGLWVGFCSGYLNRLPRVDDNTARYLRRQQILKLVSRPSIYGPGIGHQ